MTEHWLAENLDDTSLIALKGDLAGLYKLREGDYRIIYEIIRKEEIIIIHSPYAERPEGSRDSGLLSA